MTYGGMLQLHDRDEQQLSMTTTQQHRDDIELAKQMINFNKSTENRGHSNEAVDKESKKQKMLDTLSSFSSEASSSSSSLMSGGRGDLGIIAASAAATSELKSGSSSIGTKKCNDNDVLSGRGGGTNLHPGNRYYRDLIFTMRKEYDNATKSKKPLVSKKIVAMVRENGGRFLSKNRNDGLYYDIGDAAAREKTSQALRHRTFEMRRDNTTLSARQKQREITSLNNDNVAIMKQNAASSSTPSDIIEQTQGLFGMRPDSYYLRNGMLPQLPFGSLNAASFPMMSLGAASNSSPFGATKAILDAATLEGLQAVGGSPYGMARPTQGVGLQQGHQQQVGAEEEEQQQLQEPSVVNQSSTESADEAVDVLATVAMMARPAPLLPAAADLVAENEAEVGSGGQDDTEECQTREAPLAREELRPTPKQLAMMDLEERRARLSAETNYLLQNHPNLGSMMGMPSPMESPQVAAQQLRLDMMARQSFLMELELSRAMQLHQRQRIALEEQQRAMTSAADYPTPGELPPRLGLGG